MMVQLEADLVGLDRHCDSHRDHHEERVHYERKESLSPTQYWFLTANFPRKSILVLWKYF